MIDLALIFYDIALLGFAACVVRWALRRHRHARRALKELEALQHKQERLLTDVMYPARPTTAYAMMPEAYYPALPEPTRGA